MLKFIIIGVLHIHEENVFEIITAANLLYSDHLRHLCYSYLKQKVNMKTCCMYFKIAYKLQLPRLLQHCLDFIARCFDQFARTGDFNHLDFALFDKIVTSSRLNIKSELQVVEAIDCWLKHRMPFRDQFAFELLSKVRLSLLSEGTLRKMLAGKYVFSNFPECKDHIVASLLHPKEEEMRFYDGTNLDILFFGGSTLETKKSRAINRAQKATFDYCIPRNPKHMSAKEKETFEELLPKIRALNLVKNKVTFEHGLPKITDVMPMKQARHDGIAVESAGEAYLLGGYDKHRNHVYSVERYVPSKDAWKVVATVPKRRNRFCACSFMGRIYVFGGTSSRFDSVKTCASFDPSSGKWRRMADMVKPRVFSACCAFQGRIVVSGGYHERRASREAEEFDPIKNEWKKLPCCMVKARYMHASVQINNKLYMVGGHSRDMEVYDGVSGKFAMIKCPYDVISRDDLFNKVAVIGSEMFLFQHQAPVKYCPEQEDGKKWSTEINFDKICKSLVNFCCVAVPKK